MVRGYRFVGTFRRDWPVADNWNGGRTLNWTDRLVVA